MLLKPEWLPEIKFPKRKPHAIVVHWTGGASTCSELDKEHYHFIVEGDGDVIKGDCSIRDNCRPMSKNYAAHALNFNGGAIGVSLCGMAGAKESPFNPGKYPINERQWDIAARVVAELCIKYGIAVTYETVLQHGEIQKNTGVAQRGKWDCCKLPWQPEWNSEQVCRDFRLRVMKWIDRLS